MAHRGKAEIHLEHVVCVCVHRAFLIFQFHIRFHCRYLFWCFFCGIAVTFDTIAETQIINSMDFDRQHFVCFVKGSVCPSAKFNLESADWAMNYK